MGPASYVGFLVIVTAGNAVGGTVFVALLKYGFVVRGGEETGVAVEERGTSGDD